MLQLLNEYKKENLPQIWLFEGKPGEIYNKDSAEEAFKKVLHKSRIDKKATLQNLRHSFAVHLLNGGYDIENIQNIMGIKGKRSANIYKHLSIIKDIDILGTLEEPDAA